MHGRDLRMEVCMHDLTAQQLSAQKLIDEGDANDARRRPVGLSKRDSL